MAKQKDLLILPIFTVTQHKRENGQVTKTGLSISMHSAMASDLFSSF